MTFTPNRADLWQVTLSVDGKPYGVFDGRTGGDIQATDTRYKPGNLGTSYSLGGTTDINNITIKRNYQVERDTPLIDACVHRVGKARVACGAIPLDADGNTVGKKITWTGTLIRFQLPEHDSESSDAGMLEIELSLDGSVAVG